jgi:hypothetical protein
MVDCTVRSASGYSTGDNPFPWPRVFAPVGQGEPITVMATPQTTEDIEVCVYAWHGPPELFQIPEELTHVTLPASSGGFWIPELPPGKYALWVKVGWEDVVTRRCYGVDIRSAAQ